MSNRSVTTLAGIGFSPSRMAWICGGSRGPPSPAVAVSGASASRNRCWRSTASSRSVLATASSTWTLARIGRPCSSQVYQVTPTPASCATSSRRSPAVRRRCPPGSPTSSGVIRSRRLRRNAASSRCLPACLRAAFRGAAFPRRSFVALCLPARLRAAFEAPLYRPARLRAAFEAPPSLVAPPSLLSPGGAAALWLAGGRPRWAAPRRVAHGFIMALTLLICQVLLVPG